jgi:hypothetical protein
MTVKEAIELVGFLSVAIPFAFSLTTLGLRAVELQGQKARDTYYDSRDALREAKRHALR